MAIFGGGTLISAIDGGGGKRPDPVEANNTFGGGILGGRGI